MKGPYRVPYCALHYAIAFIITLFRRKIRQSLDFVEMLRQRIQIGIRQPVFHVITPRDVFDTWTDTKNRIVSRNLVIEMKKFTRRKENMRREIEKRWEKLDSRTNFHLLAKFHILKKSLLTVERRSVPMLMMQLPVRLSISTDSDQRRRWWQQGSACKIQRRRKDDFATL